MATLPHWISVYRDRHDEDYQNKLSELLSIKSLKKTSSVAFECDLHSNLDKRITLKFSGLSSLSLLGGSENYFGKVNKTAEAFKKLILNASELGEYTLDIQLLFSYPYSDFNYNLILSELTRQDGFSVNCLKNDIAYKPNFYTPHKLTVTDLLQANTFQNLRNSLKKLQDYIILANKKGEVFNSKKAKHKVVVKFSVLNIMTCFLKINNHIFIDPYTYSKNQSDNEILNLSSPLTHIELNTQHKWPKNLKQNYEKHKDHFLSLIGHFRYLWHHPLTLIAHDATFLNKGMIPPHTVFKNPLEVNFEGKATAIKKYLGEKLPDDADAQIDLWKQYIRNEFLRHCNKFLQTDTREVDESSASEQQMKLAKIPVFIVGAWNKGDINDYMKLIKDFFDNPINSAETLSKKVLSEFNIKFVLKGYLELVTNTDLKRKISSGTKLKIKKLFNELLDQYFSLLTNKDDLKDFEKKIENLKNSLSTDKKNQQPPEKSKPDEKKEPPENQASKFYDLVIKPIFDQFLEKIKRSEETKPEHCSGLEFNPILIDTDDAEEIRQTIYRNLNQSQLGFVIQTNDLGDWSFQEKISANVNQILNSAGINEENQKKILSSIRESFQKEYFSKPNVYLEKGYLMGRLGRRKDRAGRDVEAVCVFKEVQSHTESDNITFTHTSFSNPSEFSIEFYRVIKWVWNITEINSSYTVEVLKILQKIILFKDICQDLYNLCENTVEIKNNDVYSKSREFLLSDEDKKINYQRHKYKIDLFIKEIESVSKKSKDRYDHNVTLE